MLSSVNAFGGLSSAELMTLFGAKSSSSSSISTSNTTDQPAVTGASASSANNPANAIQTILAQAQIEEGQIEQALTATSGTGSATSATVAAAYAAQTEISGGGSITTVAAEVGDAPQISSSSSLASASTMLSSLDTFSAVNNYGAPWAASLVVGTASGMVSASIGGQTQTVAAVSDEALGAYSSNSTQAQQWQAESLVPASATNAPSAATSDTTGRSSGNSPAGQSALVLTIFVENPDAAPQGTNLYAQVEAQAQQLILSFENNTLSGTSANNATGFSFAETDGAATNISITGIEESDFGSTPISGVGFTTDPSANTVAGIQGLVNESSDYGGGWNDNSAQFIFTIPVASSEP